MLVGMQLQSAPPVGIKWSEKFSLPRQSDGQDSIGVGTPFYGEHKGVVLLAGGSNFPDVPLVDGGAKRDYSDIYALTLDSTNWLHAGQMSQTVAAGISATTLRGVVCVGGSVDGEITSRVFLLSWDATKNHAVETSLPDFPGPVQLGGAAASGNHVYVAGGSDAEALTSDVWMLDLDAQEDGWHSLPSLPGVKGRVQAQVFVQNGDQKRKFLYVIGGYAEHEDGGVQSLTDGYAFDLSQSLESGIWRPISPAVVKSEVGEQRLETGCLTSDLRPLTSGSDLPAWPLIGAKCVTVGDQHVLFFGGLDSNYFDDNQRKMAKLTGEAREAQSIAYQSVLPTTWNRHVLVYHTVTDSWFMQGEVPFSPTVAGSAIKRADGSILLASGEIQPGIRTSLCVAGKFVE
ncbi:MAG: hypothetical protein PF904_20220 [Kiritimatiellae bacterium]|jgi:N-acetylneuraminic acid mutarotase|nr:hypothetical protein [Kiritimatiellia bacterium]